MEHELLDILAGYTLLVQRQRNPFLAGMENGFVRWDTWVCPLLRLDG